MSGPQYTPWAFGTASGHIYERQTGTHIATVDGLYDEGPGPFRDRQWVLANGTLIAAAPEMYEALQKMLPLHEDYNADVQSPSFKGSRNFQRESQAFIEHVRDLLARAGGGK